MAVARVFGRVDGAEVILQQAGGDRWNVPVPLDIDGEYVVEIMAEDEAGNQTYLSKMLYTVDAGNICIHALPLPKYIFDLLQMSYQMESQFTRYLFTRLIPICQEVAL
ncbi:Ig-like domain repeat protein [Hungatella hathewayi]|uniref:PF13754 domain-containing protein n=1 Tax=Hungatella hathewayi TaxID=154046 RepID=UPI00210AB222|nr:PF13754 domain-containing protein [Hungatella hathewayi]MCQ5384278.1 Ig-like domain repeat protein [Hungatella hathewayi]